MVKMHYNTKHNDLNHIDEGSFDNDLKPNFISKSIAKEITKSAQEIKIDDNKTLSKQESPKKIENPVKPCIASNLEIYTGTTTSCTSSTDSGVNISDNDDVPYPPSPTSSSREITITVNPFEKQVHENKGHNKNDKKRNMNNGVYCDDENYSTIFHNEIKSRTQQQQSVQQLQAEDKNDFVKNNCNQNEDDIESENIINFNQHPNNSNTVTTDNDRISLHSNEYVNQRGNSIKTSVSLSASSSLSTSSTNSSEINSPSNANNCNSSPVVSIRSICSSTIITSDSDSECDPNDNIEGVHENYVIKKLGTQVTYPPKHPDIPNINSGHTLLNQQVTTVDASQQPSPLATLAAIGDSFGQAHAIGTVPSVSGIPQRPQIGSIALSNSSNVTFGDKHFYEGPVTIQQFLIDARDKLKDNGERDNPTFGNDNSEVSNKGKDINSSAVKRNKLYDYISKRKVIFVPGALVIVALFVVGITFGVLQNEGKSKLILGNSEESRKNIPMNSTIDTNSNNINADEEECSGNGTLCLIQRDVWRAHLQKNTLDKQKLPLHRVIISHTASEPCDSLKTCSERVRIIQEFHMESLQWDDIAYNFLISSDGRVYVGRGWDAVGAHTKGYNYDSVGIAFIGTYVAIPATEAQLKACLALLDEGQRLHKLSDDYHVYGARQFGATESPGNSLYRQIKKWKRWSLDINPN